jgi:hypothetical protein
VALVLAAVVFGVSPLAEQVRGPLAAVANGSSGSVFPLLPWAGYVYLGAALGATHVISGSRGLALWFVGLAALGILLWYLTPQLADAYPPHQFWVTNPANHARRWTQVCGVALLLMGLEQALKGRPIWLIEVFGTSSLAAYFFHEMLLFYRVFGLSFARFWLDQATWPQYWLLLGVLLCMTFGLTWLTDRVYRRVM